MKSRTATYLELTTAMVELVPTSNREGDTCDG